MAGYAITTFTVCRSYAYPFLSYELYNNTYFLLWRMRLEVLRVRRIT